MTEPNVSIYSWLESDSLTVAPKLLGWELVSQTGGQTTSGLIVETEAYHGAEDPASHAFRGLTKRTAPMFESGGTIYVYFTYGMYNCVNIVTGHIGEGQAILIRALEPLEGTATMAARRGLANPRLLASGPGRLTQALGITTALSGTRLGHVLSLRPPHHAYSPDQIIAGPRVGISRAQENPWRFYIRDNPFVSRPRKK